MCRQVFEVSGNDFINENGRDSHMGGYTRLNYGTSMGRVQSSRLCLSIRELTNPADSERGGGSNEEFQLPVLLSFIKYLPYYKHN